MVPRCVDEYLESLRRYPDIAEEARPEQDVWHLFDAGSQVPSYQALVNFSVVNNLIAALGSDSQALLLDYLERYDPQVHQYLGVVQALIDKGLNYYRDFELLNKKFRVPTPEEQQALVQLRERLAATAAQDEDTLQGLPLR